MPWLTLLSLPQVLTWLGFVGFHLLVSLPSSPSLLLLSLCVSWYPVCRLQHTGPLTSVPCTPWPGLSSVKTAFLWSLQTTPWHPALSRLICRCIHFSANEIVMLFKPPLKDLVLFAGQLLAHFLGVPSPLYSSPPASSFHPEGSFRPHLPPDCSTSMVFTSSEPGATRKLLDITSLFWAWKGPTHLSS